MLSLYVLLISVVVIFHCFTLSSLIMEDTSSSLRQIRISSTLFNTTTDELECHQYCHHIICSIDSYKNVYVTNVKAEHDMHSKIIICFLYILKDTVYG